MKLLKPLSKAQWKRINTGLATTAQAIILFAIAAVFVPETVGLDPHYSKFFAIIFFIYGLLLFVVAVILTKEEEQ